MTDDLKERLLDNAKWGDGEAGEALNCITELENALVNLATTLNATAAAQVADLEARLAAAEAGEAALAKALREIANCGQSAEPDHWKFRCMAREKARAALAAYETRRKK